MSFENLDVFIKKNLLRNPDNYHAKVVDCCSEYRRFYIHCMGKATSCCRMNFFVFLHDAM